MRSAAVWWSSDAVAGEGEGEGPVGVVAAWLTGSEVGNDDGDKRRKVKRRKKHEMRLWAALAIRTTPQLRNA